MAVSIHTKRVTKPFMASVADIRTYVYGAAYDSWNRVQTMTYPDGEVVTYHYNAAGQVESLTSNKQGRQSVIVDRIGYDKEGHTVYTKLGNGTETTYTYDKQRERLQVMNLTADGQTVMENRYRYDAVDNILGITNAANPTSLTKLNKAKLGGRSSHTYEYDELNRLIHASGKAKRASYDMVMSFGRMSEPLTKVQKVDSTTTAKSYNFAYKYEDSNHSTAPTQIGHDHYTYDANGNPTLVTNDSANTTREMYWDEDNRLMVLSDNGKTSRYTYNAAGERIMKSYGTMEGVYINGAPQGITFHETDNFTLYPASIISINKNRFTKHYFIGDKRIASRIGTGLFNNVYGRNGSYITAGQQDYAERMNQIQKQKEAYYKEQGIAPGVPTMKGAYGDPENTGRGYNSILDTLGNHDVPQGWIQTPRPNTTPGTTPGAPVSWNDPSNPDDPQPGYGYIPNDTTKEETFFYHSAHLGSTSYITDDHANITQYDAYLPYGELLVDEHSSSEDLPYKFNGKQFDEETGLYYYGARYMNPVTSLWYGVDKLTEKYPTVCGYVYTLDNPVKFIDELGYKPSLSALRKAAKKLGVELSVIRAVFQTETEGQTYTKDGRIKILYERHYFSRFTHGKYDKDRDISAPTPFKGKTHKEKGKVVATPEIDRYGNLPNQYRRFEKAKKLDEEAAYSSISYGSFQIMGSNYKDAGYKSAKEFGDAMFSADEDKMLDAFTNYISANHAMRKALLNHDWATFARLYNGPGYKGNKYDTKMAENYKIFSADPFKGYKESEIKMPSR